MLINVKCNYDQTDTLDMNVWKRLFPQEGSKDVFCDTNYCEMSFHYIIYDLNLRIFFLVLPKFGNFDLFLAFL